jgi:hypothetical protein
VDDPGSVDESVDDPGSVDESVVEVDAVFATALKVLTYFPCTVLNARKHKKQAKMARKIFKGRIQRL